MCKQIPLHFTKLSYQHALFLVCIILFFMKKCFPLSHPKIHPDRLIDSIRAEVNKYLKRERNKKLPEGFDFWDFDCRVGTSPESALSIHVSALSKAVGETKGTSGDSCYVEILAKPKKRIKKQDF